MTTVDSRREPLLPTDNSPPSPSRYSTASSAASSHTSFVLYRSRFLILFTFSLLSFNQSLFWLTFSPISDLAEEYYGLSVDTVNLLLNWGPIIYIPCQFLTFYISSVRGGLRKVVLTSSTICLLAMCLRCVPNLVWHPESDAFKANAIYFLHAAQILNAAAGPFVMSTVSQCSALWFGINERAKATSIAIFSNNLGAAIGFLQMPAQVRRADQMPSLLYTHAAMALFASLLTLAYFPAAPPTPPSHAAELMMYPVPVLASEDEGVVLDTATDKWTVVRLGREVSKALSSVLREFWSCCRNPSFFLLALGGGGVQGVFNGWSALFNNILGPLVCGGSATCDNASLIAGWFGFSSTIASVLGGFIMGAIADTPRFCRRMKLLLLTSCTVCFACFCWFIFSVPTPVSDIPILSSTTAVLGVSITAAGFALGFLSPLYYELSAEITYPTPEQYSAGVITLFNNGLGIIFIYAQPYCTNGFMNAMMFLAVIVTGLMLLPVKEQYRRRDDDERKKMGQAGDVEALDEPDLQQQQQQQPPQQQQQQQRRSRTADEEAGNGIGKHSSYKQKHVNGVNVANAKNLTGLEDL